MAQLNIPGLAAQGVSVFCLGNGGMAQRDGRVYTHRDMGQFLRELANLVGEVVFCAWLDDAPDPMAQTRLDDIPGVRSLPLPRLVGGIVGKCCRGAIAFVKLFGGLLRANFVYVYWPGRISSITVKLCRVLGKPYGIYFRGEQIEADSSFGLAFREAKFVITAGNDLKSIVEPLCADVANVTPMTSLRKNHLLPPRPVSSEHVCHLLYVGRLERRKGTHDLLSAAIRLTAMGIDFDLTLVGHCYDPCLRAEVPVELRSRVHFVEALADFDDLIPYYRDADIFVLPSHDEGFPRVLYEAMGFGLPIVTTFVGSISSLLRDGDNCLRIEVRNPDNIASRIRELVENPKLRYQIALAGYSCVKELMESWRSSHAVQVTERLRAHSIAPRPATLLYSHS